MYPLLRSLLFALPPETAHCAAMSLLDAAAALPPARSLLRQHCTAYHPRLERLHCGLHFPNPVGLAAGFDKDAQHLQALALLSFGFIEIGTVTPRPQPGNPQPRLFRLPADQALINRMGFNNAGAHAVAQRLHQWRKLPNTQHPPILGANIGKNKDTPNERAHEDYLLCFHTLFPYVDYFALNVSSPNTPGLRNLQAREPLLRLLETLQNANQGQPKPKPMLLKIAPDMDTEQLDQIALIAQQTQLDGIIATNTTLARQNLRTPTHRIQAIGAGGLSGAPLRQRATQVIQYLRQCLGPTPLLIGVGGIDSPSAAREKILAGANLVQVYTGLIYQGPTLVRRILTALANDTP